MIGDFFIAHLGKVIGAIFGLLLVALFFAAKSESEQRARFMQDCTAERPEYECTAMWRAGEKHTTYIPVVIPR